MSVKEWASDLFLLLSASGINVGVKAKLKDVRKWEELGKTGEKSKSYIEATERRISTCMEKKFLQH